jgi:hypothetical protein
VAHQFGLPPASLVAGLGAFLSMALLSVDRWNRRGLA